MPGKRGLGLAAALFAVALAATPAGAHEPGGCPRAVIFALPGVTWDDVVRVRPPNILSAADAGALGSLSVRTVSSRTTYASGFASIGAGARVEGGRSSGYVRGEPQLSGTGAVVAAGTDEMRELLDEAGYTTVHPGALAAALEDRPVAALGNSDLGTDPPTPLGRGRWGLLAAMDIDARVDVAVTGTDLLDPDATAPYGVVTNDKLVEAAHEFLAVPCMTAIVDPGDTTRADAEATNSGRVDPAARDDALQRADRFLGAIRGELDEHDLLLIVSPTSPAWDPEVHFGIAIATGPGFPPGTVLTSPATRRGGLVTLPDIAPTVLQHFGIARPSSMLGRAMYASAFDGGAGDRAGRQVHLDREAVFIDGLRPPITTVFVVLQVLLYAVVALVLRRRDSRSHPEGSRLPRFFIPVALAVVAFPVATYLGGLFDQVRFGTVGFVVGLLVIDALVVAAAYLSARRPFDRLLVVTGATYLVLIGDLLSGAHLQLNTVFSYSALVAGRFAGIGNTAYSVLAAVTVITAALVVHRGRGSRRSLIAAAVIFAVAVVVDAAPQFGSDVGGILALVPGLSITWMLLAGRRPRVRTILLIAFGLIAAVGIFLAIDLAQPEESRTHLARLFEDARARGFDVFSDVIQRKIETNLRVFRSTIWTFLVPPALALIAWLLFRPPDRWQRATERYPRLRAGLVSCLVVAVLGFAVNDSGIVVPAMMLSFLVALALFMHLSLEAEA